MMHFQKIINANSEDICSMINPYERVPLQVPVWHKGTLSQLNMSNYLPFVKKEEGIEWYLCFFWNDKTPRYP